MSALGELVLLVVCGLSLLGAVLAVFDRHLALARWVGQSVTLSASLVAFGLTLGRWRIVPLARRTRAKAARRARMRRAARRAPAAAPQGGWREDSPLALPDPPPPPAAPPPPSAPPPPVAPPAAPPAAPSSSDGPPPLG